jgi:hypothetical protein
MKAPLLGVAAPDCSDGKPMGLETNQELGPGLVFAGRYRLERLLGSGGMGKVYVVSDIMLPDEKVALKVLKADIAGQEGLIQRFLREVQLTRRVTHRNVVRTFDVGNADGRLYFTMEVIEGKTLRDHIAGQPLPTEEVLRYLAQLCYGLTAIHHHDIVHRDLKSSNVIVSSEGILKITDFGVARPGASELTGADEILGSATHIAPETWKSGDATPQSDIYALGVICYEMVTGILPFDNTSPHELMFKHLKSVPVPPIEINPEIPRWLSSLILRMLEKEPTLRPASAESVVREANSRMRRSTVEDVRALPFEMDEGADPVEALPGSDGPLLECGPSAQPERALPQTVELSFADRVRFTIEPAALSEGNEETLPAMPAEPSPPVRGIVRAWATSLLRASAVVTLLAGIAFLLSALTPQVWVWGAAPARGAGSSYFVSALLAVLGMATFLLAPLCGFASVVGLRLGEWARIILVTFGGVLLSFGYVVGYLVSWGAHDSGQQTGPVLANAAAVLSVQLGAAYLSPLEIPRFIVAQVGPLLQLVPQGFKPLSGPVPPIAAAVLVLGILYAGTSTISAAAFRRNHEHLTLAAPWALLTVWLLPVACVSLLSSVKLVLFEPLTIMLGAITFSVSGVHLVAFAAGWIAACTLLAAAMRGATNADS